LTLYDILGVKTSEAPICLVELWDSNGAMMQPEDQRKCIALLAMAMRDRLLSKDAAKRALIDWSGNEILSESEVEQMYSSPDRLTCKKIAECHVAFKQCDTNFCEYPTTGRDPRAWHGADKIKIEDVCEISQKRDGSQAVKFSPDKAAATIVKEYSIVSTPDERIWIYQDGIYSADGEVFVDQILDRLAGDLYNSRSASETHRKIVLRTLKDYSIFDDNPYLFCIQNGVVDMATGKFMKHDPALHLTSKAPIRFDSRATCPEIEKFLGSALATQENVLSFLDIMTAKTTDLLFEFFVALIGGGSNGKTIAEELIRAFFGDEVIAEVDLATLTQNRFDRREIFKKKFLINSEVSGDVKESRWIKYISGGGRIDADQKGKEHIQFRPRCLIIFDTNNPPRFADSSYAFQRRLVKIDFPNTFVDDPKLPNERQRDPFVIKKITCQQELSGLLNLLMLRAKDVLPEKRIYRRASGATLVTEYEMQANSLAEFFDKFCEFDSGSWVSKSDIYEYYKKFCQKINAVPRSQMAFNKYAIKSLRLEEARKDVEKKGFIRIFWGVELDQDAFNEFVNPEKITSYQVDTENLPEKSIALPGLPTLPTLKRIIDRIVCNNGGDIEGAKKPENSVNPGTDNEKSGRNLTEIPGSLKDQLRQVEERRKENEAHFKTPMKCEECGENVDALHEIGQGEFVMRMCKSCYDAYLDDISN